MIYLHMHIKRKKPRVRVIMICNNNVIYYAVRLIIAFIKCKHGRKYRDRYNCNFVVVPLTTDYYIKYSTGYPHKLLLSSIRYLMFVKL